MAFSVGHLPLAFLLFLTAASLRVQARESKFFSKAVRYEPSEETTSLPEGMPAMKKEDPATLYPQNHNGYGLYSHGPEELNPTTTTAYSTNNNDNNGEVSNIPNTMHASQSYEAQNYNNQYGTKPTTTESNYKNTEASAMRYPNYVYPTERQGMSDTRFLENGKYFYDVSAENYPDGFDPTGENSERYGSYNGVDAKRGGYGNNYGSNGDRYEHNNAKVGYQNNQENLEGQEEYAP